jgi:hypothetical protein
MLGIAILILAAGVAFMGTFFYQYWKPKYGSLVIKTTPAGAMISVDGKFRGVTPITLTDMRSGGRPSSFHSFIWRNASRITHSPSGTMRPLSSATGMN